MLRLVSAALLALATSNVALADDAKPAAPATPATDAAKPADAAPTAPATDAAKPADAPAATDAKPADAAPANGALSVSSTPNGKVFLDGKDTGLTTPVVDLPVAPGPHTLKVVEEATGRETSTEFTMEAGGSLNLNLNLPEAAPKPAETKAPEATATPAASDTKVPEPGAKSAAEAETPWTWMTVAGWAGLGLGTIGLLSGSVVLTTPTDPDQGPLGFGLFGAGVGLLIGGGVLLYLDTELADSNASSTPSNTGPAPAEPAKSDAAPAAATGR